MRDVMQAEKREVEGGGYAESAAFTVVADQKMFKILISGLYADKPRAIVRELWSNCFDTHSEKGIPERPFLCHLPTRFEPFFSVRDFGVSMSHETVMHLYSQVGRSTKEMSNASVGKFGLGSKTPFAYTDQFSVTTWLDGTKRIYNAFIDGSGIPMIALFHTEESDEENGVQVEFPVQPRDIDAFLRAAKTTILGFDVAPILTGAQIDLDRDFGKVVMQGEGWLLRASLDGYRYNNLTAHIRQGCVVYPLDTGALDSALASQPGLTHLLHSGLVFDVPIGSVDITPSRESLSYDPVTIGNIVERLKVIRDEIEKPFAETIKDSMRRNEAMEAYKTLFENMSSVLPRVMVDDFKRRIMWRGQRVMDLFGSWYIDPTSARVKVIRPEYVGWGRQAVSNCPRVFNDAYTATALRWDYDDVPTFILHRPGLKVPYAGLRVGAYVKEHRKNVLWVQGNENDIPRLLVLMRRPKAHTVIFIEDLPNPVERISTGPREKGKVTMKRFVNGAWVDEKVSVEDGGLAFFMEDGEVKALNDPSVELGNATAVLDIVKLFVEAEIIEENDPIYLVPSRSRKSVLKHRDVWSCMAEYGRDAAQHGWTKADADAEAGADAMRSTAGNLDTALRVFMERCSSKGTSFSGSGAASKLGELWEKLKSANTSADGLTPQKAAFKKLAQIFGVKPTGTVSPDVAALEQEISETERLFWEAYPMFRKAFYYGVEKSDLLIAIDYINLVDSR
jgi:hypothetical protein